MEDVGCPRKSAPVSYNQRFALTKASGAIQPKSMHLNLSSYSNSAPGRTGIQTGIQTGI